MVDFLAVKRLCLVVCAVALTACSSGQGPSPAGLVLSKVKARFSSDKDDKPKPTGGGLTREVIDNSGGSAIYIKVRGDEARTFMTAISIHGGYVTFISQFAQSVTLRGSFVTASRGMGADLLSASSSAGDPLVQATPVADWPAEVTRQYSFPGQGPRGTVMTFTCTPRVGAELQYEIVEVIHDLVTVTETCRNTAMEFENTHYADVQTGFVWRSRQWLGPVQGWLDLEVIEPYTGG